MMLFGRINEVIVLLLGVGGSGYHGCRQQYDQGQKSKFSHCLNLLFRYHLAQTIYAVRVKASVAAGF
jgi:hypothetical protein